MYRLWLVEQCCSWLIPLRNYHKKYTFENTKPTVKEIPLSLNLTRPFESKSKSNPKRREKKKCETHLQLLEDEEDEMKIISLLGGGEREREREILGSRNGDEFGWSHGYQYPDPDFKILQS